MFQAVLILSDGTERFTRDENYRGHLPMVLVWPTTDKQGAPFNRTFIHDPRRPPDGSGEYVPRYLETVGLTVEIE